MRKKSHTGRERVRMCEITYSIFKIDVKCILTETTKMIYYDTTI